VFDFKGLGVALGMRNRDDQIKGFAQSCFNFCVSARLAALPLDQEHDPQSL
jgi:hypothetical protein